MTARDGQAVQFVELVRPRPPPPPPPAAGLSRRFLPAGLTVKDSATADRFYKDTLGFSETWRGGRPEGGLNWINMRAPDCTDSLEHLLLPASPPDLRLPDAPHPVALLATDLPQRPAALRAR